MVEQFVDRDHLFECDIAIGVGADAIAVAVRFPHGIRQIFSLVDQHAVTACLFIGQRNGCGGAGHAAIGKEFDAVNAQGVADEFFG